MLFTFDKTWYKSSEISKIWWITGITTLILVISCSLRHELFKSTAWDLGIFDQAVYLISQGKTPISTFLDFHILGDHAAFIFYPLALLYKIYPTVYWLFLVQALALALGAIPIWYLAADAGLKDKQATAIAIAYLCYPLVFNINLFDFHPDVIAPVGILAAVLASRRKNLSGFCLSIILILSCKAVLSLTVAALGLWLLLCEKRRLYGVIALISGIAWFFIATKGIIPYFGTDASSVERHVSRFGYLGKSIPEILTNLLLKPGLVLGKIFSGDNIGYLSLLLIPVIWGLSFTGLTSMIGAIPTLGLNLLADYPMQKDLIHQYSLPILPFLFITVIQTLSLGKGWLKNSRMIIGWSLVIFLILAKYGYFWSIYANNLDTWQATRQAVNQINTKGGKGGVLTAAEISPHLSHRPLIKLVGSVSQPKDLEKFKYILVNVRHPGWSTNRESVVNLVNQLKTTKTFQLNYQKDDVYLFELDTDF
jgi:uncharacterized membrane protein